MWLREIIFDGSGGPFTAKLVPFLPTHSIWSYISCVRYPASRQIMKICRVCVGLIIYPICKIHCFIWVLRHFLPITTAYQTVGITSSPILALNGSVTVKYVSNILASLLLIHLKTLQVCFSRLYVTVYLKISKPIMIGKSSLWFITSIRSAYCTLKHLLRHFLNV